MTDFRTLVKRALRREVIRLRAQPGATVRGRILVQYKTDYFDVRRLRTSRWHTNVWEAAELCRILQSMGYDVDLIDRGFNGDVPAASYMAYLGLGSGGSGREYPRWSMASRAKTRILLATGARPDLARSKALLQQEVFNDMYGLKSAPMRYDSELPVNSILNSTSCILSIGESTQFGARSWKGLGKPVYNYFPGIASDVIKLNRQASVPTASTFLCFAGNGFVHKGVHLIVEAFLKRPDLELHICGPPTDSHFFTALGSRILSAPNIRYHGFVPFGGRRYRAIAERAAFSILASCSEGCSTSVAATMLSGLVPVVTPETGVNVGDFGVLIDAPIPERVAAIVSAIDRCASMQAQELVRRSESTVADASKYTRDSFDQSITRSLAQILRD